MGRLVALVLVMLAGVSLAAPHKVRVTDPALARSLVAQGGRLVADYGGFQIIETAEALPATMDEARAQSVDRFNFIQLNAAAFNTRGPESQSLRKPAGSFAGKRLRLVQFAGPIKPEWRRALEQTGATIVSYVPHNAYLVYGDAAALARIPARLSVDNSLQWDGPYQDDYKIHPKARAVDGQGRPRSIGTDTFAIQLAADAEANPATLRLIDQWKLAPVRNQFTFLKYLNVIVSLPAERLKDIAAQPDVISIQPHFEPKKRDERQDQIVAGNLTGSSPSGPGYLAWLAGKGFTQAQFDASGFVVDVSDSGIDNGTTHAGHFALHTSGDPSQSSRISYSRLVGSANPGSTLAGCDGHGALNAHIIGGYVDLSGYPHTDSAGFSYGLGVCPFVKVGASVIFDPTYFTIPNYAALQTQAYNGGARISNNSWGADVGGAYDVDAQSFDALVRDVGATSGQRPMVTVFVAGNAGPDSQLTPLGIESPGTAKNVITVGASENVRSLSIANGGNDSNGYDGCSTPDSDAADANGVLGFSSQGPCSDGRIKPDLVAPGTHITGGVPQNGAATTSGTGTALPCFDASFVCALPGSGTLGNLDNFFPLNQQFYTVSTGTSHAAPAVSGACALLRQYFINHNLTPPSPAMTKAFLMNSARYLTGVNANDTLWSPRQGMGGLNLGAAFDGTPRVLRDQFLMDKFTASGQTRTFSGTIVEPTKPFRVTLAWTDTLGSTTAGQALVNDLDLSVTIGGNTYKGNVFSGASSVTGGAADSLNNVESVFLPAGVTGSFTVTVTAANIAADGVVNGGSVPEQDFALVIYNDSAASTGSPFVPSAGSYSGLFSQPGGVQFLSSGAFTAKTTSHGAYSGTLQMGAKRYSFHGSFDGFGVGTNVISRNGLNPLTLMLQMDTTDNGRISGTVSDGTWLASLDAYRAVFSVPSNPALFAGKYTLTVSGSGDAGNTAQPLGDGYGAITVDPLGRVKFSGALPDGTKVSQSATTVSATGRWPLYVSLYGGQGQILGWLTFSEAQTLSGAIHWTRPPLFNAKYYPDGFDIDSAVLGSVYQLPPLPSRLVLGFTSGAVELVGGNLGNGITNGVTISWNNKVSSTNANKLTLTLNASQGLFKGNVVNPATAKTIPFNGAILQSRNSGSGFFLGADQSGRVFFGP